MCRFAVVFVASGLFWVGQGLKVQNLNSSIQPHETNFEEFAPERFGNDTTHINSFSFGVDSQQSVDSPMSNDYVGCNSTTCFMNTKKVKSTFKSELVLILGCSLDINAIGYYCQAATGVPMDQIVMSQPFAYLAFCTVGHFTVVYAFHPGATPPPYGKGMQGMEVLGTSRDIVTRTKNDIQVKFGRPPTAIVVDASLWDVSSWYDKSGSPPWPYPIAPAYVQQWCSKDLPDFLMFVAATYPHLPIALRTPPTVFGDANSFGISGTTIDQMVQCVETHKDAVGKVYTFFDLIDFHHFVDTTLVQAGAGAGQFYKDSLHPGAQLSLLYMNNVLTWVTAAAHLAVGR